MIRKRVFHLLLVFFTCLIIEGHAFAKDTQIPHPVGDIYVQDFADVLTADEENQLKSIGRNLEDQTTAQVAVLTVNTTDDIPIEQYANEAFRQYGIGSKEEDNGVLLLLVTDDHQIRIEVGYGLEGRIPDGKAGRILEEYAIPYLKDNQPNQAVVNTYEILANEVATEYGVELEGQQDIGNQGTTDEGIDFPEWLLIIIIVVVVFLDLKFFGGTLTYFILSILSRGGKGGGGSSGGGPRGGGGGSSGGGGAGRGW